MFTPIRCEADLYGYSCWLSYHLKLDKTPVSKRGFQHGWIWWDPADLLPFPGFGLDPNTNRYSGLLVQDKSITESLLNSGTYATEGGLPFLNFYYNSGLQDRFKNGRMAKVLFVPTHSNPWNNNTTDILQAILEASEMINLECTVMLGGNDQHLKDILATHGIPSVVGAQVYDVMSFIRLQENFESHEFMITDTIGSHVCYGLHCGMKVGILQEQFEKNKLRSSLQYTDGKPLASYPKREAMEHIASTTYLKAKFPGLVYGGGLPKYSTPPLISNISPEVVVRHLGWDLISSNERDKGMQEFV
jgi:hypothetical protein